jgi:hypothetical protein
VENERLKSEKYDDAIFDLQGRKIANGQRLIYSEWEKGDNITQK